MSDLPPEIHQGSTPSSRLPGAPVRSSDQTSTRLHRRTDWGTFIVSRPRRGIDTITYDAFYLDRDALRQRIVVDGGTNSSPPLHQRVMVGTESVDIIRAANLASGNMRTHAAFRKGLRDKETSGISYLHATPPASGAAHRNSRGVEPTTRGLYGDSQRCCSNVVNNP
jgi:hypothetical protein